MSKRIQRKRTRGWRMPHNCVYVGRPTRWGNPHPIGECPVCGVAHTREEAIAEFSAELRSRVDRWEFIAPLVGKDLACWCPLGTPCHADVLLELLT